MSSKRFYQKEIAENPVWILGQPFRFDLLVTEDANLIRELDKCAKKGVGGVKSLSEAEYTEEVSKKKTESLLQNSSQPSQRRNLLSAQSLLPSIQRAAGGLNNTGGTFAQRQRPEGGMRSDSGSQQAMPEPITVPTRESFGLPPLAKAKDVKL